MASSLRDIVLFHLFYSGGVSMNGGGVVLTLGGDVVREFECAEQAALWLEIYGDPRRSDYAIGVQA